MVELATLKPHIPLYGLFCLHVLQLTLFTLNLLLTQHTGIRAQVIRPEMAIKFEVVKFDGRNDFSLWHVKIHALLVQKRLSTTLKGRVALPTMMLIKRMMNLWRKCTVLFCCAWVMRYFLRLHKRIQLSSYG